VSVKTGEGHTLSNYPEAFGPLNAPHQWPSYVINRDISVRAGTKTKQSGIYLPDVENSCAQFLSMNYEKSPDANVLVGFEDLLDPATGEKYDQRPICEKRSCVWYLIERTSERGEDSKLTHEARNDFRIQAGGTCPDTGFYFTPARPGSRRVFQKGEVMPAFDTAYGTTIWQWDSDQK
jgi:hypothetical protein